MPLNKLKDRPATLCPMTLFASHITALKFWMSSLRESGKSVTRLSPGDCPAATAKNVRDFALMGLAERENLHAVVSRPNDRRPDLGLFRMWNPKTPRPSFLQIGDDLHVSTPEACFLQLAGILDAIDLIIAGMELCGQYVIDTKTGALRRSNPITTPEKILDYLNSCSHVRGLPLAKRALKHVVAGAQSPKEIELCMRLCLPRRMGGLGVPKPEFNPEIRISPRNLPSQDALTLRPDLFWSPIKYGVEYDSKLEHFNEKAAENDSQRRALFSMAGYSIDSVLPNQLYRIEKLQVIAIIVKKMYRKLRPNRPFAAPADQIQLRKQISSSQAFSCLTALRIRNQAGSQAKNHAGSRTDNQPRNPANNQRRTPTEQVHNEPQGQRAKCS
ncbi:MAG: hypothetical protein PUD02_02245 [Eggerthellales bacterium]|nr:hypothetical protein [Eggerthellales bacterium]